MNKLGSTHLTASQRGTIQELIGKGEKLSTIAKDIDKDERTVSREIKKHRQFKKNGRASFNNADPSRKCARLNRYPYVCNGCRYRRNCSYVDQYFYDASVAQKEYTSLLSEARTGLDLTLEEKTRLDAILKDGCEKNQSIYHIIKANPDEIPCSVRSVYRMVDRGQTVVQNIDLVRKVKLKPRKHYNYGQSDNFKVREGRRMVDFLRFIQINGFPAVTEIDTVEGPKKGSHKCLLTIHNNLAHFTMAFLLESKTSSEVSRVFIYLQNLLGPQLYKKLFQVILTDRGTEFIDPEVIETDQQTGEKLTSVFFCDSYASYQKGSIEQDHTLIRRVIPKGTDMDDLTQQQIDTMMSHIACYFRVSIDNTPYNLFSVMFGKDTLLKLKIREILPDQVTLKPSILR